MIEGIDFILLLIFVMFLVEKIEIGFRVIYIQGDIYLSANCTKGYIKETKRRLLEKYNMIY